MKRQFKYIMEMDVWCEVDEWFIDVIELIEGIQKKLKKTLSIQWSFT